MNKLRDQKGLTMVELLVTVVIVLLFSGLVAVGPTPVCGAFVPLWRMRRRRSFAPR